MQSQQEELVQFGTIFSGGFTLFWVVFGRESGKQSSLFIILIIVLVSVCWGFDNKGNRKRLQYV